MSPCEHLEWDSLFFGRRIGRVIHPALDPDQADSVAAWADQERVDCLYFLCDATDGQSIRVAEEHGFRLVDIRVSMEHADPNSTLLPQASPSLVRIRPYRPEDLAALQAGARVNHLQTRFFRDPGFPRDKAEELYAIWLAKSCADPEAAVFVAEMGGKPVGYLSCHVPPGGVTGHIALAGVHGEARGKGLGTLLVHRSLRYCAEQGAAKCQVITQGSNIPALRLYTSLGFFPTSVQLWFHRWALA